MSEKKHGAFFQKTVSHGSQTRFHKMNGTSFTAMLHLWTGSHKSVAKSYTFHSRVLWSQQVGLNSKAPAISVSLSPVFCRIWFKKNSVNEGVHVRSAYLVKCLTCHCHRIFCPFIFSFTVSIFFQKKAALKRSSPKEQILRTDSLKAFRSVTRDDLHKTYIADILDDGSPSTKVFTKN